MVHIFGSECKFSPKNKLLVYNAQNKKRKHEVFNNHSSLNTQTVDNDEEIFTERQRNNAAIVRQAQSAWDTLVSKILDMGLKMEVNLPFTRSDLEVATRI